MLGSTALMLQTDYIRGTKDSDVLGVDPIIGQVAEALLAPAGKDTPLHREHQVYLEVVGSGAPFLPRPPRWNLVDALSAGLRSFEVLALDITDDQSAAKVKQLGGFLDFVGFHPGDLALLGSSWVIRLRFKSKA